MQLSNATFLQGQLGTPAGIYNPSGIPKELRLAPQGRQKHSGEPRDLAHATVDLGVPSGPFPEGNVNEFGETVSVLCRRTSTERSRP